MMIACKNIVFDFDGTLVSCKTRQVTALKMIGGFSKNNLEKYWSLKREGKNNVQALTSLGVSISEATAISNNWRKIIENPPLLSLDALFDDSVSALESLTSKGYEIHLLTARNYKHFLSMQLKNLNIHGFFRSINVVNPQTPIEEKAEILKHLKPIAFVGDSEVDLAAARAAGINFKAVSTGQRSEAVFSELGVVSYRNLASALLSIRNEGINHAI